MKIKVAILGTGNIGTDLLLKCLKNELFEVVAFVGRRVDSESITIAKNKNVKTSACGIKFFIDNPKICDVVFDCTNATDAILHSKVFEDQNIKVIDLTPAKVGDMCIPDINGDIIVKNKNINMITCGGQASLPMLNLIKEHSDEIEYIEVVSQISSFSAGMATRINIDEYIKTTKNAITKFTGCSNNKVILNLNPAVPCVDMQTTIFAKIKSINLDNFIDAIAEKIQQVKKYIPYYELLFTPMINSNGILIMSIKVKGSGDYLPEYAGNLDIINCAAINVVERFYKNEKHNNL